MSATESLVVKSARAGPSSPAQLATSSLALPLVCAAAPVRAGQLNGSDLPVPRWSNTSKSREPRAGAIAWAMNGASGTAAWPGPVASATTASRLGAAPANRRSTLREMLPGSAPLRSSGTGTVAQVKPALLAALSVQGVNGTAPAAGAPSAAKATLRSVAASTMHRVSLSIVRDVSGNCPGRRKLRSPTAHPPQLVWKRSKPGSRVLRGLGSGGAGRNAHPLASEEPGQRMAPGRLEMSHQRATRGQPSTHAQIDLLRGDQSRDGHPRHIGVAVELDLALRVPGPAGAKAPDAQGGHGPKVARVELGERLQRELTAEVSQRLNDRVERPARPSSIASRRRHVAQAGGRQRREALQWRGSRRWAELDRRAGEQGVESPA